MKRISYLTFAAMLALCSCTDEISEEGFVDKTKTISFSAYSNKTRAYTSGDIDNATDMQNGSFGVVGYNSDNNIYLYKNTNSAVEQVWKPSGESGSWEYSNMEELKFWPEGSMDFYAYFPYSDNATFEESDDSDDSDNVMTITGVDCSHDVLFAKSTTSYTPRVPLTFYHAFSKIQQVKVSIGDGVSRGYVKDAGVTVEIQKVEFINTSTSGTVKVDNSGVASYEVAPSNVTLSEDLSSPVVTVNSTTLTNTLIGNSTSGGYLFATTSSTSATNYVMGTGKTMWDGDKNNITGTNNKLSESGLVCLKLTCKVWNGTDSNKYYYLGGDSNYDAMYIPLKGTDDNNNSNTVDTFEAGKRYIYNIVFKNNVGYKDNGDPVLRPILFKVNKVESWGEVTVTITL